MQNMQRMSFLSGFRKQIIEREWKTVEILIYLNNFYVSFSFQAQGSYNSQSKFYGHSNTVNIRLINFWI